jgi:PHD/YefM family antitoxin component YafN of YafNO toxin-antitoxin module
MSAEPATRGSRKIEARYVVDEDGKREFVLLPAAQWEKIMDDLDDLYDVRAYDAAKAESEGGRARPAAEVFAEIDAELEQERRGVRRRHRTAS